MEKLVSLLKSIRLRQVLTVLLVGIVLLVNTACSKTQAYDETMKGLPGRAEPEMSRSARIKPEPKSGMNAYSDTDPRLKTTEAEKSAQGLVENAKQNVIDQTDDLGTNTRRILDKKNENLEQVGQNLKQDTRTLGNQAQNTANQAQGNAAAKAKGAVKDTQRASEDALNRTESAARNTGDRVQAKTQSAADDTQQASGNIFNKVTKSVKRAAEDASDFVGDKTEQASKGTQRALEDTSDAISGNRA